jgi:hypothetical protein
MTVFNSVRKRLGQEAPSALPLFQLRYTEMTAASPKYRVQEPAAHGGGIAAVQWRGYFYVILLFEPAETLEGERALNVTNVVALMLTGRKMFDH